MAIKIHTQNNGKLVGEKQFKLECEVQNLFEANLDSLMGLTLIFDSQTNAFVIIEVKADKSLSVVDGNHPINRRHQKWAGHTAIR